MNFKSYYQIFLVLILSGYFFPIFPADDGFSVNGNITNLSEERLSDCTIELRDTTGKLLRIPIKSCNEFSTSYTVAPVESEYIVIIRCSGYEPDNVKISYGGDVTPSKLLAWVM